MRGYLFYALCIPTRVAIAWNIERIPRGVILVPALGFLFRWFRGQGQGPSELGFFGGPVYWKNSRLVHSALWFGAYIWYSNATDLLLFDVLYSVILRSLVL